MPHLQKLTLTVMVTGVLVGTSAVVVDARAELGESAPSPLPVAGSRLVPLFLSGEDDSRQFVGWFDRARGDNCAFGPAGDGVLRCLPVDAAPAQFFVDVSCKRRMAAVVGCSAPKYLVEDEPVACGSEVRRRVMEAGAAVRPSAVYAQTHGACARVPLEAASMYVMVGREVPPASFVAAHYTLGRPVFGLKTEYDPQGS
jgi:hypothetical protein